MRTVKRIRFRNQIWKNQTNWRLAVRCREGEVKNQSPRAISSKWNRMPGGFQPLTMCLRMTPHRAGRSQYGASLIGRSGVKCQFARFVALTLLGLPSFICDQLHVPSFALLVVRAAHGIQARQMSSFLAIQSRTTSSTSLPLTSTS